MGRLPYCIRELADFGYNRVDFRYGEFASARLQSAGPATAAGGTLRACSNAFLALLNKG